MSKYDEFNEIIKKLKSIRLECKTASGDIMGSVDGNGAIFIGGKYYSVADVKKLGQWIRDNF